MALARPRLPSQPGRLRARRLAGGAGLGERSFDRAAIPASADAISVCSPEGGALQAAELGPAGRQEAGVPQSRDPRTQPDRRWRESGQQRKIRARDTPKPSGSTRLAELRLVEIRAPAPTSAGLVEAFVHCQFVGEPPQLRPPAIGEGKPGRRPASLSVATRRGRGMPVAWRTGIGGKLVRTGRPAAELRQLLSSIEVPSV